MAEAPSGRPLYRFGPFELNTGEESLARNGIRVKVQDLPYRLLVMLMERPGEIVTREEVRQRLWPENTFVEFDNSLGVAIRKVRDALNDDAEAPRYVETIPRRGYRFVAPVTVLGSETPIEAKPPAAETKVPMVAAGNGATPGQTNSDNHRRYWVAVVSLALVLVGVSIYGVRSLRRRAPSKVAADGSAPSIRTRRSVAVLGFRNLPGHPEDNWLSKWSIPNWPPMVSCGWCRARTLPA